MATKLAFKDFIQKAWNNHGYKYDYTFSKYINSSTYIDIICPIHGKFTQAPNKHLRGYGCYLCGKERTSDSKRKNYSTNDLQKESDEVHGIGRYDLSEFVYSGYSDRSLVTCNICSNKWYVSYNNFITGKRGCPECYGTKKKFESLLEVQSFIDEVSSTIITLSIPKSVNHSFVCRCSLCEYIWEPLFGNIYYRNYGCPNCSQNNSGFWNPEYIRKHHTDKLEDPCTLYVIECYSEDESFIKVGITTRSIEERYHHKSKLNGYQYDTLYEYHSTLIECSEIEQELLGQFKDYQYEPMNKFVGFTECIDISQKDNIFEECP